MLASPPHHRPVLHVFPRSSDSAASLRAVAAAGDMPICVGTSHPGTHATRGLSQMAEECGAAAVMVTPSKEGVPLTDDRMVEYFKTVADGISIKVVLQDHPASTLVNMSVPLLARLVRHFLAFCLSLVRASSRGCCLVSLSPSRCASLSCLVLWTSPGQRNSYHRLRQAREPVRIKPSALPT